MTSGKYHFTDEELLRAIDGELTGPAARRIPPHLAACPECRTRMEEIRATMKAFNRIHRAELDTSVLNEEVARHNLETKISHVTHSQQRSPTSMGRWGAPLGWCLAGLLLACGLSAREMRKAELRHSFVPSPEAFRNPALPDRNLTPGSYRSVRFQEVCPAKPYEQSQVTSEDLRRKVLREYGMTEQAGSDHEIDYLVIPELGGTDDVRNLWPEPYDTTEWNAHVKDELEEHLHQLVCERKLDIAIAQRDIATNWISAYKKYFRTDRPLPSRSDS